MTQIISHDILDLATVKPDPVTCVNCIDWDDVPLSSAKKDFEQGRLLAEQTFREISWNEYPGSLTALMSKILTKLPESKEYYHITQGFSEILINDLMKIVKTRETQNTPH